MVQEMEVAQAAAGAHWAQCLEAAAALKAAAASAAGRAEARAVTAAAIRAAAEAQAALVEGLQGLEGVSLEVAATAAATVDARAKGSPCRPCEWQTSCWGLKPRAC